MSENHSVENSSPFDETLALFNFPIHVKWIWTAFAFVVIAFAYSCYHRSIHIDDAWLSEMSYFLSKDGILKSEAFSGWEHSELHVFFTHQLLIRIGAVFARLFGYGAYQMKMVGLMFLLALMFLWYLMLAKMRASSGFKAMFLLLLLGNCRVFDAGFMFRPELALSFFISVSYFLLLAFKRTGKSRYAVGAGLACAIAIGFHLNGVVCVAAGVILLLKWKKLKHIPFFLLPACFGFAIYFIDIRSHEDVLTLFSQFHHAPSLTENHFTRWHYLLNLLGEHRRFFATPSEMSLSVFLIVTAVLGYRKISSRFSDLLVYSGALVFFVALIAQSKTPKYMILYIPFLIFIICAGLSVSFSKKPVLLSALLVAYFASQAWGDKEVILQKENRLAYYAEVTKNLSAGTRILAPFDFVFFGLDRFRIRPFSAFLLSNQKPGELAAKAPYNELLNRDHIQAIVFDKDAYKEYRIETEPPADFKLTAANQALGLYFYERTHAR